MEREEFVDHQQRFAMEIAGELTRILRADADMMESARDMLQAARDEVQRNPRALFPVTPIAAAGGGVDITLPGDEDLGGGQFGGGLLDFLKEFILADKELIRDLITKIFGL